MTLSVECGFCGGGFEVDDIHAGRRVRCPTCKRIVRVPPHEEFLSRTTPPRAGANSGAMASESGASRTYELEEGRPTKAEPAPAPPPQKPEERAPGETDGVGMRRVANVLVIIVAVSAALAIWNCFSAVWLAIAPMASGGVAEVAAGFQDWAHGVVPSLTRLRPGMGRPLGGLDQVMIAAILAVLALRVILRSASLGASYDGDAAKAQRPGLAGLVFHFLGLMMLIAVIASAGTAASEGHPELSAWLLASFMALSALSFLVMLLASGLGGVGAMGRMFNDGVFGAAAVVLLCRGGVPHAPFGILQQCVILVLANSIVGFAISAGNFERQTSSKVVKGLGFSVLGVIILVVAVVLFSVSGQVR